MKNRLIQDYGWLNSVITYANRFEAITADKLSLTSHRFFGIRDYDLVKNTKLNKPKNFRIEIGFNHANQMVPSYI